MAVIKVSCGFFGGSLMEALEQAKAGDTLLVAPGKYCHETLRLENITLKSEIPGAAVIFDSVVVLGKVHLEGINLRGRRTSPVWKRAQLFMRRCGVLDGGVKTGISTDCGAQLKVENCKIHAGISLLERSRAAITNTEFEGSSEPAILIDGDSAATIDCCQIHDSGSNGIFVTGGVAEVRNSELWECGKSSRGYSLIYVRRGSQACIEHCRMHDGVTGVRVDEGGLAEVRNSEFWAFGTLAIGIQHPASIGTIVDCLIHDNAGNGIRVRDGAKVRIQGCDLHNPVEAYPLIHVGSGAHATLDGCKVHDTRPSGICVQEGGTVEVRDTDFWACRQRAVYATDRATAVHVIDCRFGSEVAIPIYLEGEAYGKAEKCEIPRESCAVRSGSVLDFVGRRTACDECIVGGQPSDSITLEDPLQESQQIMAELDAVVDVENETRGLIYRTQRWRN
jgi:Right handed beta helix region